MEEKESLEIIRQLLETLWDSLGIKKSVAGFKIREFLVDHICSTIMSELSNEELQKINVSSKKLNDELNKVISDIIRLYEIIVSTSASEEKTLLYALLLAASSASFPVNRNSGLNNNNKQEPIFRTVSFKSLN